MAEAAVAAPVAPAATDTPAPAAAPVAAQAQQAGAAAEAAAAAVETAAPKPGESAQDFELRLSKLTREARIARESETRLKASYADLKKRYDAAEAELSKAKSKRMTRSEFIELNKKVAAATDADSLRAVLDDDANSIPPEMRERMEKMEAKLRERDEEDQRRATDGVVQRELKSVADDLAKWKGDFPLLAGNSMAPEHLRTLWYQEWEEMGKTQENRPSLREITEVLHENIANTVASALQSPEARQFLIRLVPGLGKLLREQEASAGGPESDAQGEAVANGRNSTSTASRPDPKTLTEEQARALRQAALEEARKEWRKA